MCRRMDHQPHKEYVHKEYVRAHRRFTRHTMSMQEFCFQCQTLCHKNWRLPVVGKCLVDNVEFKSDTNKLLTLIPKPVLKPTLIIETSNIFGENLSQTIKGSKPYIGIQIPRFFCRTRSLNTTRIQEHHNHTLIIGVWVHQ